MGAVQWLAAAWTVVVGATCACAAEANPLRADVLSDRLGTLQRMVPLACSDLETGEVRARLAYETLVFAGGLTATLNARISELRRKLEDPFAAIRLQATAGLRSDVLNAQAAAAAARVNGASEAEIAGLQARVADKLVAFNQSTEAWRGIGSLPGDPETTAKAQDEKAALMKELQLLTETGNKVDFAVRKLAVCQSTALSSGPMVNPLPDHFGDEYNAGSRSSSSR